MKQGTTTLRAFTYDAAGNPTRDARSGVNTDYGYDNAGRLRTVKVANSLEATYTYDAFDRLAIRTLTNQTPSGTTHFIHMLGGGGAFDDLAPGLGEQLGGLGNRIIGETNGAGVLTREYAWIDDRVVAVLADANAAEPLLWWVTNDHLGRPVQMTDSSQAVVWRAAYRPFGEVISVTGTASFDARFPGQWFQLESGLAYNWHRHYDASLGRYTQADPLGVKAGPSVYGYAGGNPVMGVDPEGRQTQVIGGVCGPYAWVCVAALTVAVAAIANNDCKNCSMMSKGGKQNIDNEYVREIQAMGSQCPDPCEQLRQWYRSEHNPIEKWKIKTAMKRYDCDGKGRYK